MGEGVPVCRCVLLELYWGRVGGGPPPPPLQADEMEISCDFVFRKLGVMFSKAMANYAYR